MTTNYLIWSLIKPSNLILFAALVGCVFWAGSIGSAARRLTVVLVVAFGLLPAAPLLMGPLEERFPMPAVQERVDGIIVLAGSERGALSARRMQPQLNSMGDRLTTFLLLAARYPNARLIHSGYDENAPGRELLENIDIDRARLSFEERSRNTCESSRELRELLEPDPAERWIVVTSGFHLPRTVACFRAVDWEILPYPADYRRGPSLFGLTLADNLEDLDLAAHEWLGLLYYRLRGHTRELFPGP